MHKNIPAGITSLLIFSLIALPLKLWAQSDSLKIQDLNQASQPVTDTVVVNAPPIGSTTYAGTITDALTNAPLAGISVSIPDYSSGITDDNGVFTIYIPSYATTLLITGAGYQTKEVPLKGRKDISIKLHEESFPTVYQNAYLPLGLQSKSHSVNSVVSLNTRANAWQTSAETSENFFQGKIPGLNVIRRSGTPGIGANSFLRGYSSLNATNQPLVVVDGMIYDVSDFGGSLIHDNYTNPLSFIDIKDIDNITVIKDALSLYGSKGANGVILINTIRSKELATRIDFSAYTGFNYAPKNIPLMGVDDYRTYISDILQTRGYTVDQIQSQAYMNDDTNNPNYYRYHNNTDWQREILRNSYNRNYHLKVSGGDNIAKYALSLGYLKHDGIIKTTDMQRFSTRFNADLNMTPRLTANTNLSFVYGESILKDQGLSATNPILTALIKAPFLNRQVISDEGAVSPNLAEADILNVSNPSAIIEKLKAQNRNYRFFGSANFRYQFTKSVSACTMVGVTYDKIRETLFIPQNGMVPDTLKNAIAQRKMGSQIQRLFSIYSDSKISYNKTFNRIHSLDATVGMRYLNNRSETDFGLGYNSATDAFQTIGTGINKLRQVGGDMGQWTWLNYYAGINYQFNNKYFFSVTMALDGSSRFGKDVSSPLSTEMFSNSFAFFPSVGAGWLISAEDFMSNYNFVEMLKIRASYGLTGNDDIGNYTSRPYYVAQNFLGMGGLVRGNLGNPAIQWERNRKFNAGLDLALFNERIALSFDVYQNTTDDLITYEPLGTVEGFDFVITNNGSLKNTGVEVALNARIVNTALKWDLGLNIAKYKNEITALPVNDLTTSYAGATILTSVGQPLGVFYGYKTNGVFTSDEDAANVGYYKETINGSLVPFTGGDVFLQDVYADNLIDENDRTVIGDPNPDFTGMLSSRWQWKSFALDAAFTFSYGNDVYNYVRARLESMSALENQTPKALNRWRRDGQVTDMPKAYYGDPMGNARFSDRWIEDGSYLRLRTLTLSYDLPLRSNYFKYSSVYVTGNNLFTLTNYLGYDPEFSVSGHALTQGIDVGQVPQFKSLLIGIRIGF